MINRNSYEQKFWFMFICTKFKTTISPIGSQLVLCKIGTEKKFDMIQVIGYYADSHFLDGEHSKCF